MKNTFSSNGNHQYSMGIPNGGQGGIGGKGERQRSRYQHGADQGNQLYPLDTTTTTNKFYNGETPWTAPHSQSLLPIRPQISSSLQKLSLHARLNTDNFKNDRQAPFFIRWYLFIQALPCNTMGAPTVLITQGFLESLI
jgi:hypothetical protein